MLSWHWEGERCTSYKTSSSNNIYLQKADASVRTHINQGSFFLFFLPCSTVITSGQPHWLTAVLHAKKRNLCIN